MAPGSRRWRCPCWLIEPGGKVRLTIASEAEIAAFVREIPRQPFVAHGIAVNTCVGTAVLIEARWCADCCAMHAQPVEET